jgi:hypothetical protein
MDTMLIQLTNQKAFKLLHELEELNLIKVLKQNFSSGGDLSDKYAGKLPSDVADELQKYVLKSREEWEK